MGWRSWSGRRADRGGPRWGDESFDGREWDEHFRPLGATPRRAIALAVCREVLAAVPLDGDGPGQALAALESGRGDAATRAIGSLVDRLEGEYDALIGGDEGKLMGTDPAIRAAFVRARAASALHHALKDDLAGMAYEAWFALDCRLDAIRRLAEMPGPG